MNTTEKRELVEQIADRMQRARACLVAEYKGLKVADLTILRRSLDTCEAEFRVAKNRLVKIAVRDDADFGALAEGLTGQVGITYMYGDLAQGIKRVLHFQKENDNFRIKTAVMNGSSISAGMLQEIADLPSREVLMARLIGTIIAPHRQLITVLQGVPRSVVMLLAALRDRKRE